LKENDWVVDTRNGAVFKIEKVWGEWVLCDNYIDSGDVYLIRECRPATQEEINTELQRRNALLEKDKLKQIS
jgi:hypothetical protein